MKAREWKKYIVHERDGCRCAFDVEENAAHHRISVSSDVAPAEAHRFESCIHTAFAVLRSPTCRVQKQADAANLPVTAQIKPVQRPPWHTNQIAWFDFNPDDWRRLWIDVENSPALNNEADLVFSVDMLTAELGEHHVQTRCPRIHVDYVC